MKERPISFQPDMVRAILKGRTTQTRRVIKDPRARQLVNPISSLSAHGGIYSMGDIQRELELTKDIIPNFPCPYGQVGDRLWVREMIHRHIYLSDCVYSADNSPVWVNQTIGDIAKWQWQRDTLPSIFMPRWASRIDLDIVGLRVERVQEISHEDAIAEGAEYMGDAAPREQRLSVPQIVFSSYWDSLNAKRGYSWESNPWVWVIEFVMSGSENQSNANQT